MFRPIIAGGLSVVALRTVFGLAQLKQRVTNTRAPIGERLLRSPGESLRVNLEKLNEKLVWCLALFAVVVKPILTFPGWYVTRTGKSDVSVLNPKEIRQVVLSTGGAQLSPQQIQRVVHQVEQKCRDVVF